MALHLDPEVQPVLAKMGEATAGQAPPAAGDWAARRAAIDALLTGLSDALPANEGVTVTSHRVPVDGAEIEVRQFVGPGATPTAAVVYLHGGGMICGSLDCYQGWLREYAANVPEIAVFAVEYRLAPEHPHPVPVEDCWAGLRWVADHAADLGIDPDRIAVAGDSAGGGLAAGVALLARERGPRLARQVLIYPMLDDRTTAADPGLAPFLFWTADDNLTGWRALLGDRAGGADVPSSAAPAREADLAGLPPAFIDVGELDLFCAEDIAYAARLAAAGVPIELHVRPGVPHGFDAFAPGTDVANRALADRLRVFRSLAD